MYVHHKTTILIEMTATVTGIDMISNIGGTLGLFTGFSIISGVEIIHWLFKCGKDKVRKMLEKKRKHLGPKIWSRSVIRDVEKAKKRTNSETRDRQQLHQHKVEDRQQVRTELEMRQVREELEKQRKEMDQMREEMLKQQDEMGKQREEILGLLEQKLGGSPN